MFIYFSKGGASSNIDLKVRIHTFAESKFVLEL